MKTVCLGRTGLEVSRIGLGGIPITRLTEAEAIRVVQHALDAGITFIDTARRYGPSEERIGKAIVGRRGEVVLATKTYDAEKGERATALADLELSLRHLGTDYIDLWQFHGINTRAEYERLLADGGALEAAHDALRAGKIRHVGISGHHLGVARTALLSGHFETVQFPFNFVNDDAARELVPLARERNVGFIAMKPFAGGQLREARLALRYLLQFEGVVPDPGFQRTEEIDEAVRLLDSSLDLAPDEWREIEAIREQLGRRFCQWCGYCQPCPQGVDIPMVMNVHTAASYSEGFRAEMAQAVATASQCVRCGECMARCPFGLPTADTIAENARFFAETFGGGTQPV